MWLFRRGSGRRLFAMMMVGCLAMSSDTQFLKGRDHTQHHVTRLRHSRHLDAYSPIRSPSLPPNVAKLLVSDNHKPIFKDCSKYRPIVLEEQPIGTYVFTIVAEDIDHPDMGGMVTYKFVTTPGEKERFHVESGTGKIFTADIFDHDEPSREKETYITVRATDNGHPPLDDACTIKIIIEDINDNQPVFDKVSYSESVPADLLVGREVMRISATDIDDGNNSIVRYSLDENVPDSSYFHIDPDNGVIFLNKTIDKPPGYKFKLGAIVKDKGEPFQQSSITLDITIVESNKKSPSFTEVPDGPVRIRETYIDFASPVATLRAVSNIPEEKKLQFELVAGQTEQTNKYHTWLLEPDGNVAFIKLAGHLDYEKITDYMLTVRIQNNYRLAAETVVHIEIIDENDSFPIFSDVRSGMVPENEPPGTFVMQIRAFDSDVSPEFNQVTYELGDPTEPFAIDPQTGNITTLRTFDREQRSFYNVKIYANDNHDSALLPGRPNSGQQVFLIEISDKNDNPPHFTQDTYVAESIAENANINELVTQVTALDVDTASRVTYSIVAGNTYNAFTIRNFTGEIRVNSELDYENITSYSLDVRAFDGIYEDYAKVMIKIENLNDNPPVFIQNYTKTIEEEKLYDGCIVRVEAYDPDIKDRNAPQNIVYSLVKLEQKTFLEISNDGCLRLTKPLDRDQPTGFARRQILIMAADHGGRLGSDSLRSTTEIILELTDINDNAPFLTNTQPVIWYENEPPGQIVVLTAKDYDSPENGPPFTFALNQSDAFDVASKFLIQGNILYAVGSFDREETKEYVVPILITDSGTPRMTGLSMLRIVIGDKNDNPMSSGHSNVFVYNYRGEAPDTEIGRVYVVDPDDWDVSDKRFMWLPSYELRSPYFDVHSSNGMITMKEGTPSGNYILRFNVTEVNEPRVPFHWVEASVNVTVKEIPEEAVDKSGSIRFLNITAEEFIVPEVDGFSKKDKLHRRLAKLYNVSMDNVDVFTVSTKQTVKDEFLDVRFSAHGSPYYSPEKLDSMVTGIQDKLEDELGLKIYMVHIDECLIEREQCEDSCRNVLMKNNVPLAVYTNATSFIGVSARVESECTCELDEPLVCLNGGTPFSDKCECPDGYLGPRCEATSVGFHGDGWAMYPPPPACHEGHMSLSVVSHTSNCLIFYMGPLRVNNLLDVQDFMSLELQNGYPVLLVNYGSGTTKLNNSVVHVADGKPHLIEIIVMRSSIEMFVDRCKLTTCMSLAAPTGTKEILNINGPMQLGGASVDLKALGKEFDWRHIPNDDRLVGCVSNFSYNDFWYNLGDPSFHKNADPSCSHSMFTAVTFGIDTNFLVAILVCIAILVILLLAVVVHRRRADAWAEKELDDIRENIIAYEDEGGGEGDAGYDLHVLRQMYDGAPPDNEGFMHATGASQRNAHQETALTDNNKNGEESVPVTEENALSTNGPERPTLLQPTQSDETVVMFHQGQDRVLTIEDDEIPHFDMTIRFIVSFGEHLLEPPSPAPGCVIIFPQKTHEVTVDFPQYDGMKRTTMSGIAEPFPSTVGGYEDHQLFQQDFHVDMDNLVFERNRAMPRHAQAVHCLAHQRPQQQIAGMRRYLPSVTMFSPRRSPNAELELAMHDVTGPRFDGRVTVCGSSHCRPELGPPLGPPRPRAYHTLDFPRLRQRAMSEVLEMSACFGLVGATPDISGFLDDKKTVMDRDPETPFDDVRHYAYEGDGNTSGSLSSLASCTDDGDLKFNYLSTFGPRFRKLADMYHDPEDERAPHEESWC